MRELALLEDDGLTVEEFADEIEGLVSESVREAVGNEYNMDVESDVQLKEARNGKLTGKVDAFLLWDSNDDVERAIGQAIHSSMDGTSYQITVNIKMGHKASYKFKG